MTDKQKKFADEYLIDLNATQAAIRAGYSEKNADKIGSELLGKTRVKEYIQKRQRQLQKKTEITQEKVLRELAALGFSRFTDYAEVGEDGVKIKPTGNMHDEAVAAIAGVKQGQYGVEIKLYDKVKALEQIGKYLGLFDKHSDRDIEDLTSLAELINDDTDDSMETVQPEA